MRWPAARDGSAAARRLLIPRRGEVPDRINHSFRGAATRISNLRRSIRWGTMDRHRDLRVNVNRKLPHEPEHSRSGRRGRSPASPASRRSRSRATGRQRSTARRSPGPGHSSSSGGDDPRRRRYAGTLQDRPPAIGVSAASSGKHRRRSAVRLSSRAADAAAPHGRHPCCVEIRRTSCSRSATDG